jgi:hypothetical protein
LKSKKGYCKYMTNNCFWCDEKLIAIDKDHIIPRKWGGGSGKSNLVKSCPRCNRSKNKNFWAKNKEGIVEKYKIPKQFLSFKTTKENHKLAVLTTVFIIKARYKKIKPNIYEEYGLQIKTD